MNSARRRPDHRRHWNRACRPVEPHDQDDVFSRAETASMIANVMKLPHRTTQLLIEQAQERKLLTVLGAAGTTIYPNCVSR